MGFEELSSPEAHLAGIGEPSLYFWLNGLVPDGVPESSLDILLKNSHIAFSAQGKYCFLWCFLFLLRVVLISRVIDREQVKQFHAAALKAGGTCNGVPGLRPRYHPDYYAAFVFDPVCGINFEVVCLKGE